MRLRAWHVAAITVIAAAISLLDAAGLPLGPVRAVTGTVFALVAPGTAFLLALGPRLDRRTGSGLARIVLTVPLSFSLLALVGVVLDHTFALRPVPMVAASSALVVALLAVAWWNEQAGAARPGNGAVAHGRGARPARDPRELVRLVRDHLRDPLFLHAYALGLSGALTSGFGVVYWAVAARAYPPDVVGVNAALLSLVMFLGNVAQLNLRSGFGRFLPLAGSRTWRLIGSGYAAAIAIAAVSSAAVIGLLAVAPWLLPDIELNAVLAWLFPLTVVLWTMFVLQDYVLTALRRTVVVPVENAVFAAAKIVALLVFVAFMPRYGILASWTIPTLVGVVVVSAWLVRSAIPRHVAAAPLPSATEPVTLRSIASYVGADYVASLFAIGSTSILPSVVLGLAGAASSAHFYVVTLIASAGQLLPAVLTTSLLVEASASQATFEKDARRVLRQMALLLVPLVALIVVAAPLILGIFGAAYANEGTTALRLYALAGLPYAIVQLAFVRLRIMRRVRLIVGAQAAMAVAIVGGSLLTLPAIGIAGIGAVILVTESAMAVLAARYVVLPAFASAGVAAPSTAAR